MKPSLRSQEKAARDILEEINDVAKTQYVSPLTFSVVHIGLGDKDLAFDYLQKSFAERSNRLVFLNVQPTINPIRSDTWFNGLLKQVGLI